MQQHTMRFAVWHEAKDIRIEQVDVPTIDDPHEVKVKVAACGICGSDLHEYAAGPIFVLVEEPHPISGVNGHQF